MFHRKGRSIRIQHPLAHQLYNYELGRRFDPGAQAEAFLPLFVNPLFTFRGPSTLAGALQVTQPSQVYVPQLVPFRGIGGTIAGQLISQPLDTNGETGT